MIDTFSLLQKYTGISRYSQSEVITPQNIVKDMVDLLPQEVFNPDATFFDPAVKSGRFLVEIYNRLMASQYMAHIPEPDRHKHIIEKQLYGFTTSQTAALVARKALYDDQLLTGNMRFTSDKLTQELIQGAFSIMNFDVVIGNPPYNKGADLDFVKLGFELSAKYCVMIVPAKWQTAEANQVVASKNITYGKFREKLVPHMSHVVFYPDCSDVFNIGQIDGVTYFLIDKVLHDACVVENKSRLQKYFNTVVKRNIVNGQPLSNIGNEIIEYLGNYKIYRIADYQKGKAGKYEVLVNNQVCLGGATPWERTLLTINGSLTMIGTIRVIDTSDITEIKTKAVASTCPFSSDNKFECESFISWLNTKFTRFFVAINISKLTGIICDNCFRFVPAPPSGKFDHIYTDQELYDHFKLPQKYIDIIEAVIKERK